MTYDKDANYNERYPTLNGHQLILGNRYARNAKHEEFYPKDDQGNEFMVEKLGLINKNGIYVYPLTARGKPRYRKIHGRYIYESIGNEWIYGEGLDGKEYYATNENGDEYYPPDNIPAKMANGNYYYASTTDGTHVFPIDECGNEYYFSRIYANEPTTIPNRYARSNSGDQIYPLTKTIDHNLKQVILDNEYAVDKNKNPFYPKDGFHNEYYKEEEAVLKNYAVTNDGKVILPTNSKGKVKIYSNVFPYVKEENIIGRLIREGDEPSDYLTDVVVDKPGDPRPYKYIDSANVRRYVVPLSFHFTRVENKFHKRWTKQVQVVNPPSVNVTTPFRWWIILILIAVAKSFAVWFFIFRNPPNPSFIQIGP